MLSYGAELLGRCLPIPDHGARQEKGRSATEGTGHNGIPGRSATGLKQEDGNGREGWFSHKPAL